MKILHTIFATVLIASGSAVLNADESVKKSVQDKGVADSYALEPCINGDVSATGIYPNQQAEFAALELIAKGKSDTSKK